MKKRGIEGVLPVAALAHLLAATPVAAVDAPAFARAMERAEQLTTTFEPGGRNDVRGDVTVTKVYSMVEEMSDVARDLTRAFDGVKIAFQPFKLKEFPEGVRISAQTAQGEIVIGNQSCGVMFTEAEGARIAITAAHCLGDNAPPGFVVRPQWDLAAIKVAYAGPTIHFQAQSSGATARIACALKPESGQPYGKPVCGITVRWTDQMLRAFRALPHATSYRLKARDLSEWTVLPLTSIRDVQGYSGTAVREMHKKGDSITSSALGIVTEGTYFKDFGASVMFSTSTGQVQSMIEQTARLHMTAQ